MKDTAKKSIKKLKKSYYNYKHKKEALMALENIEEDTGYKLTKTQKEEINTYAKDVFGSVSYSYWLYVYTAFNQKFKEGWIPDNYFGNVLLPSLNKGIGHISSDKTLSKRLLQSELLPDKAYLIDCILYDLNFEVITPKDVKNFLFDKNNELFFKKNSSLQGKGVIKMKKSNFNYQNLLQLDNGVFQTPIVQSDELDEIVNDNVATIRITTGKNKNGNIAYMSSYLRVGRQGKDIVDSESSLRIPVLNVEGMMAEYAIDNNWRRYEKHPDTGYKFCRKELQHFQKAVEECKSIHKNIPHFSIIGWDVSVTDSGSIKIMEWNTGHPGIKFTECTTGPNFNQIDL